MIKAEVIIDNTAWKKKIRNITLLFNKILKNLPKKYILKNKKTIITVLLSSNSKIKRLNRIFVLNVLHVYTFPISKTI